ncbi:ligand-binding SRPBCC domain-containing protein [Nocardioides thalensis]|uniref:Ligand-binding SRPBCC domain-containing protein n=1 Tax=Nocardioides thalensis TaxID=1914755 RepID=A0A853BZC7_9ACTN|nr:SRPBCC family protein [Nocardioides thalensis]NYI99737.1 ligand-binding SRPBCC domain-containing protein [Nocardioides thalensis]
MVLRREWQVTQRSLIDASPAAVWARVVTPEGINDEMRPVMTMSMPRGAGHLTIDAIVVGEPIGRAWLRLLGVLPFDYDRLTLTRVEPGRHFREESTMLSMRRWVHERTVTLAADGTEVVDNVTLGPRLPLLLAGPLLRRLVGAFFAHRHRRLARHFAG